MSRETNLFQTTLIASPPLRTTTRRNENLFFLGILLQIPLVLLMRNFAYVSTIHALGTLAIGLYFLARDVRPTRLVYTLGYIIGAEVLWRMTSATVFWEFGKYTVVLLMTFAIFKWNIKSYPLAWLYFVPLLPGIILTAGGLAIWTQREAISFNLSGGLALMTAAWFFWRMRISFREVGNLFLCIILPATGIAALSLYETISASEIDFFLQSNLITSGGFGPNQVSAILGLGAALCWMHFLISGGEQNYRRGFMLAIGIWLLVQAVLTFSRGGVFNFVAATGIGSFYLLRGSSNRQRAFLMGGILLIGAAYVLTPQLDAYTNGALSARYRELTTTGRTQILLSDLTIFRENWLAGVGPGQSSSVRAAYALGDIAPHTEYSRLLAEHGLFGLWSLIILSLMAWQAYRKADTAVAKGLVLTFLVWSLAEMSHSAMRLAATSFLFGLALASISEKD